MENPTRRSSSGERTLTGVLNVTPDSLRWRKYLDPDRAFARAVELEEEGADVIDIGAESTRPGSSVSEAEELHRLVPVPSGCGTNHRADLGRYLLLPRWRKRRWNSARTSTIPAGDVRLRSRDRSSKPMRA